MKQETLNERLDRIESAIESLADKINQIKPADINKKDVIKLIDDLSLQLKSIKPDISKNQVKSMLSDLKLSIPKPGISKDQAESMLSDFKENITKPGVSKKDVINMISDSISKIKPQERDISGEISDAIKRDITKEFITGLYRGK